MTSEASLPSAKQQQLEIPFQKLLPHISAQHWLRASEIAKNSKITTHEAMKRLCILRTLGLVEYKMIYDGRRNNIGLWRLKPQ